MIKQARKQPLGRRSEGGDERVDASASPSSPAERDPSLIEDLGWTRKEAIETRARLVPFDDDWSGPGMDAYDDL
jgi:hypothetical protein